jgi:transposase InsO family protein
MIQVIYLLIRALLKPQLSLAAENLALRQQLATYYHSRPRPKLRKCDRLFWVLLSQVWDGWQAILVIVQPATVIRWHRQGFKLFWRWKSQGGAMGRPRIERSIRELIRRMSRENPLWGAPHIQSELKLLGHTVAESTVAKYMVHSRKPPSSTWKTFLKNHLHEIAALDFFTVPTVTFRVLYVFVVLSLDRRRVLHFNVTTSPSAEWTAQQIINAFPFETSPRLLMRDRDSIYGDYFQQRVDSLGIEEVVSAPRSPWQNPFVERLIGSIRRECLDHAIVLNEVHLRRILKSYFRYYHESRTHMALDNNAPIPREVEPPERGNVVSLPQVGGLHHRYTRQVA